MQITAAAAARRTITVTATDVPTPAPIATEEEALSSPYSGTFSYLSTVI